MNLTKSKKIAGTLALTGTLMLSGLNVFAQQTATAPAAGQKNGAAQHWSREGGKRGHGKRGGFGHQFGQNLNLTDAQKEQMRQISTRYRESFKAMHEQTRTQERGAHGGIYDALKDGAFDEAKVRAAAQARANARVEMDVARSRMMSEMYAVLTPEQKAQLATERQQREQKRQEWRAQREANQSGAK